MVIINENRNSDNRNSGSLARTVKTSETDCNLVNAANMSSTTSLTKSPSADEGFNEWNSLSTMGKIKYLKDSVTVEPMLACYVMPSVLASLAIQNMNLQKACRVNLHYEDHICDALNERNTANYTQQEFEVQTLVAGMIVWKTALQSSLQGVVILFLGAWSDRRGKRKVCMLLPFIGEFFTSFGLILCTYNFLEWPMELVGIIEAVPLALTGGWMTMFMAIFSYIADVTTVEMRTFRIGVVNIFVSLGIPIGTALSGVLYKQIGFYGIFSISVMFYLAGFLYGLFFIHDIKRLDVVACNSGCANFCKDFISPKNVVETFNMVLKPRKGTQRIRIILLMLVFIVIVGPLYGETAVSYLFTRYRFNWNEVDYSFYATYGVIINLIGTVICISVFSRLLQLDDTIIGILACLSKIAASFVYAFSPTPRIFYIAPLVDIVSGTGVIAMRSIMTKVVDSNEMGKLHSLFGVCETIVPLVYNPLYSTLYVNTLQTVPGAFFLLGAALTLPAILIFGWMYVIQKRDRINKITNISETVKQTDSFRYTIPAAEYN